MMYLVNFNDEYGYFDKTFVIKSESSAEAIKRDIDFKIDELNHAINVGDITDTEYYQELEDFLYSSFDFEVLRYKTIDIDI